MQFKKIKNIYQSILNSLPQGILYIEKKTYEVKYMNDFAKSILGGQFGKGNSLSCDSENKLKGIKFEQLLCGQSSTNKSSQLSRKFIEENMSLQDTENLHNCHRKPHYFYKFNGEKVEVATELMKIGMYPLQGYIIQFREYENSEQKLSVLSYFDQLTDLPNRLYAEKYFATTIEKYAQIQKQVAVLFMDLDGFKAVNDTKGHHIGDELLKVVSEKVQSEIGNRGIVSRFGGDEFVMILDRFDNLSSLTQLSNQILQLISSTSKIKGEEVGVTASIGISCYPNNGIELQTLLQKADEAMYLAKRNGKNSVKYYQNSFKMEDSQEFMVNKEPQYIKIVH